MWQRMFPAIANCKEGVKSSRRHITLWQRMFPAIANCKGSPRPVVSEHLEVATHVPCYCQLQAPPPEGSTRGSRSWQRMFPAIANCKEGSLTGLVGYPQRGNACSLLLPIARARGFAI